MLFSIKLKISFAGSFLDLFEVKIIPSVDLKSGVDLWDLGLEGILIACNEEFLLVVSVVIWWEKDESDSWDVSSIGFLELKIVDDPSNMMKMFDKNWIDL